MTAVSAALALSGCYVYMPLYTAPAPGTRVSIELSDRGRVALEQNIGPEVKTVEGMLQTVTDDSQLVLSVTEVRGLYGGQSRWGGEVVAFRPEYVRTLRERRYSGGRTFLLGTTLAASTVAFLVTRSLLGGGTGDGSGPPGPPGNEN